jgi:uncharacterized membrane protein
MKKVRHTVWGFVAFVAMTRWAEASDTSHCAFWEVNAKDCLWDWQTLWGGVLAVIAAILGAVVLIITTRMQIRAQQRTTNKEISEVRDREARQSRQQSIAFLDLLLMDVGNSSAEIQVLQFAGLPVIAPDGELSSSPTEESSGSDGPIN